MRSLFQSFFEDQLQVPPIQGIGTEKMERREDEEAIYYDLPMENLKKSRLKITIQDGQINVSGEVQQPGLLSEFTKSLPVPRGVDAEKVDIRQEPDKIVIRFPRKK